ncbi:unnamed protein product [Bursaphelenchus okinawaensis]|uniref:Kinetochore protein Nuf2 N-terminal domain-containing protein n=1 Tax=Bursaphelenchus okinawaensis TaxID=465554 RepID=A0A811KN94_9BILA|nr:unnamed protein product [Bursaphelenchus okinawaensis]CAG9107113.1 unnamed protein product [Bursaphelenchus okinawaensis]
MRRIDNGRSVGGKKVQKLLEFFNQHLPMVGVTEKTLISPTSDDVQKIYAAMLVYTGVTEERTLCFEDVGDEDEAAANGCVLFEELSVFFKKYNDSYRFNISDLVSPDSARFLQFLQDLIKFYNVRIQRQNDLAEVFKERDAIQKRQAEAPLILDSLREDVQHTMDSLDNLRRKKVELAYQIENLKKAETAQKIEINSLDEAIPKTELEIQEQQQKLEATKERIRLMNEEIAELKGKLIQSPDRQKSEMRQQEKDLDRLNTEVQMLETSITNFENLLNQLEQVDHHYFNFMESLNSIKEEYKKITKAQHIASSLQKELEEAIMKNNQKQDELKRLTHTYEAEKNSEALKHDRLSNEVQQYDTWALQLNEKKENLCAKIAEHQINLNTLRDRNADIRKHLQDYNVRETLQDYEQERKLLEDRLTQLLDKKVDHMDKIKKLQTIIVKMESQIEDALKIRHKNFEQHRDEVKNRETMKDWVYTEQQYTE